MVSRDNFNDATIRTIPNVAVLIPCYNEELTISKVVSDFRKALPYAKIYVYDNCSTDKTAEQAASAGAIVEKARKRGKGNVVRKMFSDISADIYVIVDGDDTYNAEDAPKMVDLVFQKRVDMVIANRQEISEKAYPLGHKWGNRLFNNILKLLFNSEFEDIFSGYRAFSRRFVKTFPVTSTGFDIEAELSIHALSLSLPCMEIESNYKERPHNSFSKLHTIYDGFKILRSIIRLLIETRPLLFFGIISLFLFAISLFVIFDFFSERQSSTLISVIGTMLCSFLSITCGLTLNGISQTRAELKKLHYLHYE